ncbi:MAG: 4'-phosphopantetheinyl transferase superfamily protein [Pseudomonadota bacterium]
MTQLENDAIHIWHTTLDHHIKHYPMFQHWLSAEEKERAEKLKPPYRQRFTLTRGLLRKLLSDYSGQPPEKIRFSYTLSGKPLLLNPSLKKSIEFNVSHSRNRVAFAFAWDTPLGIDLEYKTPRKYIDKIAYRFFSIDDYAQLKKLSGKEKLNTFFNAWVRNEALVKALGYSLKTHPCSQYMINLDKASTALNKEKCPCSLFTLVLHPDFAAALAIKGQAKRIIIKQYDGNF